MSMRKNFKARLLALVTGAALFTAAGCQIDGWKLAFGPLFNGGTAFGGVELEFNNGTSFIVPIVPLGDNFGG